VQDVSHGSPPLPIEPRETFHATCQNAAEHPARTRPDAATLARPQLKNGYGRRTHHVVDHRTQAPALYPGLRMTQHRDHIHAVSPRGGHRLGGQLTEAHVALDTGADS